MCAVVRRRALMELQSARLISNRPIKQRRIDKFFLYNVTSDAVLYGRKMNSQKRFCFLQNIAKSLSRRAAFRPPQKNKICKNLHTELSLQLTAL
jgi:hypothetical protein